MLVNNNAYAIKSSCISTVLEITAGHGLFSDQFQHLANQNSFWSAKFTVHFNGKAINNLQNVLSSKKMADQFLTLISTTGGIARLDKLVEHNLGLLTVLIEYLTVLLEYINLF